MSTATTTTPRKRQNLSQTTLTGFFTSGAAPSSPSSRTPSKQTAKPALPPVPAQVQAGLLSVGMRVRKAVPEGYKSGSYAKKPLMPTSYKPVTASPAGKRTAPEEEEETAANDVTMRDIAVSAGTGERKIAQFKSAKAGRRGGFWVAVKRDAAAAPQTTRTETDDLGEAGFLRPMEEC